jgi:DNA transposition AAA+ family ATPase
MKHKYVKTSNHKRFMAAIEALSGAAKEARIMLLAGDPGVGKTCAVDYYGSANRAVHIEGMPSMTVSYVRDLLAYELGVQGGTRFAQQQAINRAIKQQVLPIILDEAQHGLDKKADVIEYLRRICEQAGSMLILVCHTSEKHRFGEHRLAHIATRISAVVEFKAASLEDCALYLKELCEVAVDERVVNQAFQQSGGRYRLLTSACATLEHIGKTKGMDSLTYDDTKDFLLCQNVMQALKGN